LVEFVLGSALLPSLGSVWSLAAAVAGWWEGGEEGMPRVVLASSSTSMSKSSSSSSICSSGSSASTDGDGFDSSNEGSSGDNGSGSSSSNSSKGELEGDLITSPSAATPHHMCIEESNSNKEWI
jgi:hypothetical protein